MRGKPDQLWTRHAHGVSIFCSRFLPTVGEGNVFNPVYLFTGGGFLLECILVFFIKLSWPLGQRRLSPSPHKGNRRSIVPLHYEAKLSNFIKEARIQSVFSLIWWTPCWTWSILQTSHFDILSSLRMLHRYQLDYNSCVTTNLPFFVVKRNPQKSFRNLIIFISFPRNLSLSLHTCFITSENLITETVTYVRPAHPPTQYAPSLLVPPIHHPHRSYPRAYTPHRVPTQPPRRDVFTHRTDQFNKRTGDRCRSLPPLWWAIPHWSGVTRQDQSTEDVDQHC